VLEQALERQPTPLADDKQATDSTPPPPAASDDKAPALKH
jgi:hypothetical protein